MKTLGKRVTKRFFLDQENGFQQLRKRWSELLAERTKLDSVDHLIYLAIMGKDIRKGFGETTNGIKLCNGQKSDQGLRQALRTLRTAIMYSAVHRRLNRLFPDILNVDEVIVMLNNLPKLSHSNLLKVEPYDGEMFREEEVLAA